MPIRELSDLPGISSITDEQILAQIAAIDVKLFNIWNPSGDPEDDALAGVDYEEHGDVGHKITPSALVDGLLKQKKMLQEMLENPAMRGDMVIYVSQWDNPDL